jgi:hypothetical protein
MARGDWILAFAVGLGASLLSGCHIVPPRPSDPIDPDDGPRPTGPSNTYHLSTVVEQPFVIAPPPPPEVSPVGFKPEPDPGQQASLVGPTEPPKLVNTDVLRASDLNPNRPEEPVIAAMRCLLENRPAEALLLLGRYDQPNQDILIEVLPWLVRLAKGGSLEEASAKELTNLQEQVDALAQALRSRSTLGIDKMCFCRRVKGFGEYEPLPAGYVFRAGSDDTGGERMQIYVEVRNFSSRLVGSLHETRLASKVEIRDANGAVEWRKDIPAEPDRSLSPRHDYYFICYLPVPPDLPPGRHSLVVEVRDLTGQANKSVPPHRIARQELSFDVAAGGSRPQPPLAN